MHLIQKVKRKTGKNTVRKIRRINLRIRRGEIRIIKLSINIKKRKKVSLGRNKK